MTSSHHYDTIVIGGGFYGARLALLRRRHGDRVLLVEREPVLLGRASLRNQARVHNGYHYPRSILTSRRSRLNYARFVSEYAECVDRSFPHYYAIARGTSKVTASQFAEFCRRIEAPLTDAPQEVAALFDAGRIEAVFLVEECAFDAVKLRDRVGRELVDAGVEVEVGSSVVRGPWTTDGRQFDLSTPTGSRPVTAPLVLNCTYSSVNHILSSLGASTIPMKHELTELALVEPPPELNGAAVTVMDGPFFSLMPYPSRGLFTLSHVRYTPHCSWEGNGNASEPVDGPHATRFAHMIHDAQRYLPIMRGATYVDSIWETKTVMPRSEQDDSRPILFRRSAEVPELITVLGAKIDSVYDVEEALEAELERSTVTPLAL
ncbi:MAG TPA: FAD-dependent oxidoreductase [Gemmatimonadaceae bacterium]|nr:FAD-dependent oxidoreductase [Gemmatimonadaceae bacterium]